MKKSYIFYRIQSIFLIAIVSIISCKSQKNINQSSDFSSFYAANVNKFDTVLNGKAIKLYQIKSKTLNAIFTNYGGRLVGLQVPDKDGNFRDVVVGLPSIDAYLKSSEPYFGATIGRFGNRIAKGRFEIDSKEYNLYINNGPNSLHGGKFGFHNIVWDAKQIADNAITFSYFSPDGEEGFPGDLEVKVTYSIIDNGLQMKYEALPSKKTVINLTNHAFFNLNGEGSGNILNHTLQIYADDYTPIDSTLIPNGTIESVINTPFDFRSPETIGKRINEQNIQLIYGEGYDHNFVLNKTKGYNMYHAAQVKGDKSGIIMDIYTQEPGLQFYSGNFMRGKNIFKNGSIDNFRNAIALETQHFPDSPNQPKFPSTIYQANQKYETVSWYVFSTQK